MPALTRRSRHSTNHDDCVSYLDDEEFLLCG